MPVLEDWLLADACLAQTTVEESMRKLRQMEREGFRVSVFFAGPKEAQEEVRRVVARVKRRPGYSKHTVRNFQKVANLLLRYAQARDRRFRGVSPWSLEPEPVPRKERLSRAQLMATRGYWHPFRFVCLRRRALLYLAENTGLRRIELGRINVADFQRRGDRWWLSIPDPAKEGARRRIPLPRHPGASRLDAYLAVRREMKGATDALWVARKRGNVAVAQDPRRISQEFMHISRGVGFYVSPTRLRRTRARWLRKNSVAAAVGARQFGQASERTFERYAGALDDDDVLDSFRAAGLPGYGDVTAEA